MRITTSLLLCILVSHTAFTQCDTLPIATRWGSARIDTTGIDFQNASAYGNVGVVTSSPDFAVGTENAALLVGDSGRPRFYFDGQYLYDADTYQRLAGGQILGNYPSINTFGSSYYQPLLLYHPGDSNLVYIFCGMASTSASWAIPFDLDMPAWLSVYDINQDSFVVQDSVLHGRATESWAAMRHPDGVSWWIATRTHSPSAIQLYKLGVNGLELGLSSMGVAN